MKSVTDNTQNRMDTPLAVIGCDVGVCMLSRRDLKKGSSLHLSWSKNGTDFEKDEKKVNIEISLTKKEKIGECKNFSLSRTPSSYLMSYTRVHSTKRTASIVVCRSRDLYEWKVMSEIPLTEPAKIAGRSSVLWNAPTSSFELYRDGVFIKHQSTKTLTVWKNKPTLVFTSRHGRFDEGMISVMGSIVTPGGILVIYDTSVVHGRETLLQAGAVLCDPHNPEKVIWRSEAPLWQGLIQGKKKDAGLVPIGVVALGDKFVLYWVTAECDLVVASTKALFKEVVTIHHPKIFKRFKGNPVIEPRGQHDWEHEGTFNPAVFQDDDGTIHLLYRAIGRDGISRVGYARSANGTTFDTRSAHPVFEPSMGFGIADPKKVTGPAAYHPAIYTSGGSWSGAEDPRAVKIGKWIYMTYVAFEGWNSVRIALTAITVDDFKHGRWHWKKPKLISPPGEVNKNWLVFPEKIGGKFAILHSLAPEVMIDYVDSLLDIETYIKSPRPAGPQPGRKNFWDTKMRGAGAPPIKTPLGWLLLYHAVDEREPHKYKLGAMILDKKDPTKVLYRSSHPILSPDMPYENEGKPGVVYASGALLRGSDLYVYYGGGDRVVCVASTPLKEFLEYLVTGKPDSYKLTRMSIAVA
ncbi:MAG: hypothetical protein V4473_02070 [Patescibacteria group bacterium]